MTMKRILLILTLLVPCLLSQAITVDELFKKYKECPNTQYRVLGKEELKALAANVSSEEEKEVLRSAKRLEVLLTFIEEEEQKKMVADLNALEGYTVAISTDASIDMTDANADGPSSAIPTVETTDAGTYPSMSMTVYGKETSSNECVSKPVIFITMWEMTTIIYIDGKIKPSDANKFINMSVNAN